MTFRIPSSPDDSLRAAEEIPCVAPFAFGGGGEQQNCGRQARFIAQALSLERSHLLIGQLAFDKTADTIMIPCSEVVAVLMLHFDLQL
jgi:hypothetical protein